MLFFKKKTEEEKEIKKAKKEMKYILKGTKGGYDDKTVEELSNGKGDDE